MEKSIIIVGAGIAGLSAGCYGQMNGYHTQIFELHDKPGGLCTSWKRKGYTFDGCLHWLVGSGPASNFHRIWEELGAVQGRTMINHDEFMRIEGPDGKVFIVYTDIDRLEQHMLELAPQDKDVVKEFIKGIRTFTSFEPPIEKAPEVYGLVDGLKMMLKMLPFMSAMKKWKRISIQEFAQKFRNPFLREAFPVFFYGFPDMPMIIMLMTLAWSHKKSAGFPMGGSLEFARAIERRYLGLGGKIHYRSRVTKILVENGDAVGLQLADGSEYRSDMVISAADGHATIFEMLEGKYTNEKIRNDYGKLPIFRPMIQISVGVAHDFSNVPHLVVYKLDKPVMIAGETMKWFGWKHYYHDSTLAPSGKSVIMGSGLSNYEYWKELYKDQERYKTEKQQIAETVIAQLEKRFPGITQQVEVIDVATPMTFERYTGNWQGSFEGWLITPKTFMMRMSKTLPGLKNFYMAGQWVEPGGGVPTAALSGRNVIQLICKQDRRPFVTKIP